MDCHFVPLDCAQMVLLDVPEDICGCGTLSKTICNMCIAAIGCYVHRFLHWSSVCNDSFQHILFMALTAKGLKDNLVQVNIEGLVSLLGVENLPG